MAKAPVRRRSGLQNARVARTMQTPVLRVRMVFARVRARFASRGGGARSIRPHLCAACPKGYT
eukprot:11226295-Lingulodinium_polyedra.AAC.1